MRVFIFSIHLSLLYLYPVGVAAAMFNVLSKGGMNFEMIAQVNGREKFKH